MREYQIADEKKVKQAVARYLNTTDFTLRFIDTGLFNTSYYIEQEDEEYVIRIAPPDDAGFIFYEKNMMAQEPGLHRLIRENTSIPVPNILMYDDTRTVLDRDYLIMERLSGKPLSDVYGLTQIMFDKVLRQMGRLLGELHAITDERYGYLGEHKPMEPALTWGEAFYTMWNLMMDDLMDCRGYNVKEADKMKQLLDTNRSHIDREVASSLLHMDVWTQNILIDSEGNVTGVVDWDRALWGDPEIEFAVLDYCGISQQSFWEGYGKKRDSSKSAKIRHLFYYLYEIQKYIIIARRRRKDIVRAERYKKEVWRILKRAGV